MGAKSVFSTYIKPKIPTPKRFYHLIHLFSRSKSIENELKKHDYCHTNETILGIGMKLSPATNETIPRNIYETIQEYL